MSIRLHSVSGLSRVVFPCLPLHRARAFRLYSCPRVVDPCRGDTQCNPRGSARQCRPRHGGDVVRAPHRVLPLPVERCGRLPGNMLRAPSSADRLRPPLPLTPAAGHLDVEHRDILVESLRVASRHAVSHRGRARGRPPPPPRARRWWSVTALPRWPAVRLASLVLGRRLRGRCGRLRVLLGVALLLGRGRVLRHRCRPGGAELLLHRGGCGRRCRRPSGQCRSRPARRGCVAERPIGGRLLVAGALEAPERVGDVHLATDGWVLPRIATRLADCTTGRVFLGLALDEHPATSVVAVDGRVCLSRVDGQNDSHDRASGPGEESRPVVDKSPGPLVTPLATLLPGLTLDDSTTAVLVGLRVLRPDLEGRSPTTAREDLSGGAVVTLGRLCRRLLLGGLIRLLRGWLGGGGGGAAGGGRGGGGGGRLLGGVRGWLVGGLRGCDGGRAVGELTAHRWTPRVVP